MFGLTNAVGALVTLGVWVIKEVAAKWGYKVALVAAVVAVYVAAFAAVVGAVSLVISGLPATPLVAGALQFLPSRGAVSSAVALYYGTMATFKGWDYFRMVSGVAAKVAS